MSPVTQRVGAAFYMPFASDFTASIEAQMLRVDCIFAIMSDDDVDYAWIDGIDEQDPVLIPVRSLEGFQDLGDLEEYLCEEFHGELGEALQDLLTLAAAEELSSTTLVRALAIMHRDQASTAAEAIQLSFQWGFALLQAASLERYSFGLEKTASHLAELAQLPSLATAPTA